MRENIEYEGSHTYNGKKSRNFRSIWLDHSSSASDKRRKNRAYKGNRDNGKGEGRENNGMRDRQREH